MSWPRRIYVATTALGVYYTDNFFDPAIQPTWTAVNTGLGALDCREFWLDPFDPLNKQYVLTTTGGVLYRRDNMGNWTSKLSNAIISGWAGHPAYISSFYPDKSTDGRIWVLFWVDFAVDNKYIATFYSDDYGDTWIDPGASVWGGLLLYGIGNVRAHGNTVYCTGSIGAGGNQYVFYSVNKGAAWNSALVAILNEYGHVALNHLTPTYAYTLNDPAGDIDLSKCTNAGVVSLVQANIYSNAWDCMWFDPTDANHMRCIDAVDGRVYSTANNWTAASSPGAINPPAIGIAPWAGDDTDNMLIEMSITGGGLQPHVIGTLYGEADVLGTGIAGTNCAVGPGYVDSIPDTCGGTAYMGIQAIDEAFYPPGTRGTPGYGQTTETHHQQRGLSISVSGPLWG